jgi:protein-disulfide isomerase
MKKVALLMFIALTIILAWCAQKSESEDWLNAWQIESLAQCLAENKVTMYGTTRCPHCQNQKKRFGKSADKIIFVDCDESRIQCQAAGVQWFPTWITPDGQKYSGDQPLESLATIGWCEI